MKTVKNANLPIKVAGFLIFAAVLVYLAIYGLRLLENPYRTVQALNTTLRDSAHTRGMVVRQEEVLTSVYNTVYITGRRESGSPAATGWPRPSIRRKGSGAPCAWGS